jgi:parvulin-like peptidyl-prolyl isomerase
MALHENSAGFGKLAAKYSDDLQTRYKGGTLPWLSKSARYFRLEPTIVKAAFKLEKQGEISRVIETKNGFYILKLIDQRAERTKPLEAVKLQIQADLKAGLKQKWLDDFHQKLKANAEIVTNDKLLDQDVIWKSQSIVQNSVPTFPAK